MDDHVETLRRYNRWRRGQDCEEMQDPRVVGDAIDAACDKIDRLRAELAKCKQDAERYRHLLSEAYVFGRTTPDIHNIPDEPVSLWLHSTVPLDVEGINRLVDAARKGEGSKWTS